MKNLASSVAYWELLGTMDRTEPRPPGRDAVVLSNIHQAAETSRGAPALSVRYVARGSENYRIGGRGYRLDAGHVMVAAHDRGADCEVRRVDRAGTLGMCTLVHGDAEDLQWAQIPIVLAADCTALGSLLRKTTGSLWNAERDKIAIAEELIGAIRAELPKVGERVLSQAAAVEGTKASTRFEMVRRANLAQAYLHSTVDRPVELREVAESLGVSPFRLLSAFQHCFGETPASYHRKLRLNRALEDAARRGVPVGAICDEFGFASASSFSHAYRRAFGRAPKRARTAA